jgi:hypothetical protein
MARYARVALLLATLTALPYTIGAPAGREETEHQTHTMHRGPSAAQEQGG